VLLLNDDSCTINGCANGNTDNNSLAGADHRAPFAVPLPIAGLLDTEVFDDVVVAVDDDEPVEATEVD
jgi:hypothetical protein